MRPSLTTAVSTGGGLGNRGLSDTFWSVKDSLVSSRGPGSQEVGVAAWL